MNLTFSSSGVIVVNGKTWHGKNVVISNGVVTVDGVRQDKFNDQTLIITVTGDVGTLSASSGDVCVNGNVGDLETVSGDITCGDIAGSVENVSGDVKASIIHGKVKTISGNIRGAK